MNQRLTLLLLFGFVFLIGMAAETSANNDAKICEKANGQESINACSKLLSDNSKNFFALYYRASTWHKLNQLDKAIADYSEVIKFDRKHPQPFGGRGDVWIDKKEFDLAIADFTDAIKLDQKYSFGYFNRARAYRLTGNNMAAIADYTEAIKLDPRDKIAFSNRGNAWRDNNDYDKAIRDYGKAISIDPQYREAFLARGTVYGMKGDNENALIDLNTAIRFGENAYHNRGIIWNHKGEYDKAIIDYNEAIKLDPNNANAFKNRGSTWADKGQYDKAIADYSEAIRIDPKYENAYNDRGLAWGDKGDIERAIVDYNEVIKLNPRHAYAYNNRADALMKKGDFTQAVADYRETLSINPDHENAKENLELALTRIERLKHISSSLQKTLIINTASNEKRVALIIGNSNYKNVPLLENPSRDAELFASTLLTIGFDDVIIKVNVTRQEMMDELKKFEKTAENSDWALVYFAGHGIEISGTNYMLPIDAEKTDESSVSTKTVNLEYALRAVEYAKKMRLIILDACRNNPYAQQVRQATVGRGVDGLDLSSVGRGLGRVEPQPGTLVVYSAKAGELALDGDGKNSPFTEALVNRIAKKPPIEVRRLFDYVRQDVYSISNKEQQPFAYGSLEASEDFFFMR